MVARAIIILTSFYIICLAAEAFLAAGHRRAIKHIVYINGTRGKSSVTRLIDAGLRGGGVKTYSKTTGTVPMIIDTQGNEKPLKRFGKPNIKEQLDIMRRAASEGAQTLVLECMAVAPELQWVSQHKMVRADIGVITNVRLDHLDVMGETLEKIGEALAGTVPKGGLCFTADAAFYPAMAKRCAALGTRAQLTQPRGGEPEYDFDENIALALAVCGALGVSQTAALDGMSRLYKRDPYALALYSLPCGALFIDGFSINDPASTELVYRSLLKKPGLGNRRLILLLNNRPDRGYRTLQHEQLAVKLRPAAVWIMGANRAFMARKLRKALPQCEVTSLHGAGGAPLEALTECDVVFAAGNLGGQGKVLMERVQREATLYV